MRRALVLLIALPLGACGIAGGCGNAVASRVVSPDGSRAAVLFQRDCGATTGFSTQISIVAASAKPDGKGNTFIADSDGGAAAASWGGPRAAMRWTAPDRLEISYDPASRIAVQQSPVAGVAIDWRPTQPPAQARQNR